MASNKILRFGPVAMANAAANIITPPTLTGGAGLAGTNTNTYIVLRHIRIVNKTVGAVTFRVTVRIRLVALDDACPRNTLTQPLL